MQKKIIRYIKHKCQLNSFSQDEHTCVASALHPDEEKKIIIRTTLSEMLKLILLEITLKAILNFRKQTLCYGTY